MLPRRCLFRALLQTMPPRRAAAYIRSFGLPEEEEMFLLECDVRGKSYVQVARERNTSPECIKRRPKGGDGGVRRERVPSSLNWKATTCRLGGDG